MKNKSKGKTKSWLRVVAASLGLLVGAGLMAYPYIANFVFEHRKDSLISTYEKEAEQVDDKEIDAEFSRAIKYNQTIFTDHVQLSDPFQTDNIVTSEEEYLDVLNLQGNGLMGYIHIPSISVQLPIYHTTSEAVLKTGVGHLEGTSLPVGGESTHSVLTGHTGLNQAKLFTDLTSVKMGDCFYLHILGRTLAYQVDQIKVVVPNMTDDLTIVNAKDYCTLITCTPYGINSHRLLVRGVRVEGTDEEMVNIEEQLTEESTPVHSEWMSQYKKALLLGLVVAGVIVAASISLDKFSRNRKRKSDRHEE